MGDNLFSFLFKKYPDPTTEKVTMRICNKSFRGEKGVKCAYCGTYLACNECIEKVNCLGRNYVYICSHRCADKYSEWIRKMKKLKTYFWDHPFKAVGLFGVNVALVAIFLAFCVNSQHKPLVKVAAAGVFIAVGSGINHLIHSIKD